ncbi:MAG TPA: histidine phosphatase family protein [Polyangiaceae bacterium]|nr:histidine phosphatase family protein [Polyangiaceae bacterium]
MSVALFIRHGKASAFASSTDYDELSAPGVTQSERLGEWLAEQRLDVSAVFIGPRKRHAQTHAAVVRVLATRSCSLPEPVLLPELDEHDGLSLVFKLLPQLASEDEALRAIVETTMRGGAPSADDVLAAFKRITRRWVKGEIGHTEVESWATFRERVARAMTRIAGVGRGKTALVFSSAGVIASATAQSLGIADQEKVMELSWSLYNGSMTELDFAGDRWGMRTFNATPHLRDRALVTSV